MRGRHSAALAARGNVQGDGPEPPSTCLGEWAPPIGEMPRKLIVSIQQGE